MCGFLGECSTNLIKTDAHSILLQLSFKRGPDNIGTFKIENELQLGFNRLSIRDLSDNGNQPYHSPNQLFDFVFNGEIYNCDALISKYNLDKTALRSTSDTEVLAHLLEKASIETVASELNGMYAIAVYNRKLKTISLLRDFAGIKPLFYGLHCQGIVFASQFNQVYMHPLMKRQLAINPQGVKEYFALGYMQAPNTIYQGIHQVEPGAIITYSLTENKISRHGCVNYTYKTSFTASETDISSVIEGAKILNDVIKRQLVSDVPTATFLSGGIDSPIITAVASSQKKDIESFTVKVGDEKINESEIAKQYAKHLGVKNWIAEFDNQDIINLIDEHFQAYPEPFGDYSSLPNYLICKLASKKFKVMLSGDGGDELLWGYPRFYNTLNHANWFSLPRFTRNTLAYIKRKNGKRVSYGIDNTSIGEWVLGQHTHNKLNIVDSFFKSKTSISVELKSLYHYNGKIRNKELLQWLRWNEFYCHMQRILIKVDRASMGNSIEVRVPFLDKEFIDFAFKLSPNLKNKEPKLVLKQIMKNYFPDALINKQKMGFTIDIEDLLKNHCKNDFFKLLGTEKLVGKGLLDLASIKEYANSYYKNKHNNNWGMWIIYSYLKWSEIHN